MACWFFRFATYIIYFLYCFGDETCKKWRSHLANLHASEAATNPSEEMSHQDIETLWWSGNRGRFYTFWRMDFYVSLKAPHWIDLAYIWHILAQWYWNWIEIGWFGCEHNSIIFNWFGSMPKNPFFLIIGGTYIGWLDKAMAIFFGVRIFFHRWYLRSWWPRWRLSMMWSTWWRGHHGLSIGEAFWMSHGTMTGWFGLHLKFRKPPNNSIIY